ncbi:MAG TPA: hypothetical protein VF121_18265, partial [Thermoanaerobaculia bacterium]|nr:hypothetical protein [Thermoanaerobaculia bacterium]
ASVEVLLEAVWLADLLHGEWTATAPYVPPPARGDWLAAHAAVEEVLGTSEVGYLAVADLGGGAEPLRVEPAAAGVDEEEPAQRVELQVLAPKPDVLFPPHDPEEGWEGEDEGAETAAAAEEEGGEETAAETPEPEADAEEPAAEPTAIEVVDESGEVVTIELTKEGGPAPEPPAPAPSADPPAAGEPAPAEPPAQPL